MINIRKARTEGDLLYLFSRFRRFEHGRKDFETLKVRQIPSLFDEIGIELLGQKSFLITERADGFFKVAEYFNLEGIFGALWYRDAEDGRALHHEL